MGRGLVIFATILWEFKNNSITDRDGVGDHF